MGGGSVSIWLLVVSVTLSEGSGEASGSADRPAQTGLAAVASLSSDPLAHCPPQPPLS